MTGSIWDYVGWVVSEVARTLVEEEVSRLRRIAQDSNDPMDTFYYLLAANAVQAVDDQIILPAVRTYRNTLLAERRQQNY